MEKGTLPPRCLLTRAKHEKLAKAVEERGLAAREAGAAAGQVNHVLLLLISIIGFPTVVAEPSWADDIKA